MTKNEEVNFYFAAHPSDLNQILLLNKPEGLLCHSDDKEFGDTLIGRVQRYLYEKKEYDPEVDDRLTERCILLIESGQM